VNNAQFRRFPVGKILQHFHTTTLIGEAVKTFGAEFSKFYHKGSFFKKMQKLLTKFPGLAISGRHNSAMITDRWKFTFRWSIYRMSSFNFYRSIHFKVFPLVCTLRTRKVLAQIVGSVRCPILRAGIKSLKLIVRRSAGAAY